MTDQRERWLTLRQVRELFKAAGIAKSDQTIRNWGDSKKLKTRRSPGGQRHFAESSVEAVIAEWLSEDDSPTAPES